MMAMLMTGMILTMIPTMLLLINMILSKKTFIDREKSTPYECGFDPLNATKESFSIQFFMISIMFLAFDIEIVILIPMIPAIAYKSINWLISSMIIMLILMVGLIIEWLESSIKWEQ